MPRLSDDQLAQVEQALRAAERDQAAIDRWVKERWPQIKQSPTAQSLPGLLDPAAYRPVGGMTRWLAGTGLP